ncbi:MAG: hypothetical protein JRJ37_10000, partial [Deltaproteobacteria bacterium]|nr:hypothetical protein [Deltaproteobacteria bacterium]
GQGTGLGLSISYSIVTEFDGTIEVIPNSGAGVCFRMTFPAAKTPEEPIT